MKTLESFAIWFLRKRKVTVLIGCEITGSFIKASNDDSYLYENNWNNVDFKLKTGQIFNIPSGKFKVNGL